MNKSNLQEVDLKKVDWNKKGESIKKCLQAICMSIEENNGYREDKWREERKGMKRWNKNEKSLLER